MTSFGDLQHQETTKIRDWQLVDYLTLYSITQKVSFKVTFVKKKDDNNIYKPAYFNSWAQIVMNSNDFYQVYNYHSSKY